VTVCYVKYNSKLKQAAKFLHYGPFMRPLLKFKCHGHFKEVIVQLLVQII